jgi:hypothetical protein
MLHACQLLDDLREGYHKVPCVGSGSIVIMSNFPVQKMRRETVRHNSLQIGAVTWRFPLGIQLPKMAGSDDPRRCERKQAISHPNLSSI